MQCSTENAFAKFWIRDGLLFFHYNPGVIIDLQAAEKIVSDRVRLQQEKPLPVLCDTRGVYDTDKAARDYLAREGSIMATAVAFLVDPSVSKAITDFYLRTSKPLVPTGVFTQEYEAIKFLENYK